MSSCFNTHLAMTHPKVGDRFQEFFSYWVYVVKVTRKRVWIMYASCPCEFPKDGKLEKLSRQEFIKKYSYDGPDMKDKYWIQLCDRDNNVKGWV